VPTSICYVGMLDAGYNPRRANPHIELMHGSATHAPADWITVSLLRNRPGEVAPTLGPWIQEGTAPSVALAADDRSWMIPWVV